jgi:hypothetical protein
VDVAQRTHRTSAIRCDCGAPNPWYRNSEHSSRKINHVSGGVGFGAADIGRVAPRCRSDIGIVRFVAAGGRRTAASKIHLE